MQKKLIPELQLKNLLKAHYSLNTQSVELLTSGADSNAEVYKITVPGAAYVVKVRFNEFADHNLAVIQLLHAAGLSEIVLPISSNDGQLYKKFEHFNLIVYPFIDGQNGFSQTLTKAQWIELGKTLRKIHTLPLPASIQQLLKKIEYSPRWRENAKALYAHLKPVASDDNIALEFKKFFTDKLSAIQALVNSSEALAPKIQPDIHTNVLCHADLHAGNILITNNGSLYIIDWDHPIFAPKERDLMFIGGGVGNVWNSPTEVEYFYQGYGAVTIDQTLLSYYRYERILEDIVLYSQEILFGENISDAARLISFKHFKSQFAPNGVVDIARWRG